MVDLVDYIKQVKRKKLEKDLVVPETCTHFGLSDDEALAAFDELTKKGILSTEEDSVVVDGKEKFQLTKALHKAWQESSSCGSKTAYTQTPTEKFPVDAKTAQTQTDTDTLTTCTQTHAQEPPPSTPQLQHLLEPTHGDIYQSFSLLAKSMVDLQYVIGKERDASRILLERNYQREKQSNTIKSIPHIVIEVIQ